MKQTTTATPSVSHPEGPALGDLLRGARERRGLTLQQISNETKIPWRHLDALERGNLSALPGGFYRRAEIRAYAQAVKLDQNVALARLDHAVAEQAAQHASSDTRPMVRKSTLRSSALIAATIAAFVVIGVRRERTQPVDDLRAPAAIGSQTPPVAASALPSPPEPVATGSIAEPPITATAPSESPTADQPGPTVPPVNSEGELTVITDPAGARVTIDGVGWGFTPITIRHLPFGNKRVRLTKDGFAGEDHAVRLTESVPTSTLSITLRTSP
jgi:cytoskeletal protein RodZ